MSIKKKVLQFLEGQYDKNKLEFYTATEVSKRIGEYERLDSVSSVLKRLYDNGEISRISNFGPRNGYGYKHRER